MLIFYLLTSLKQTRVLITNKNFKLFNMTTFTKNTLMRPLPFSPEQTSPLDGKAFHKHQLHMNSGPLVH